VNVCVCVSGCMCVCAGGREGGSGFAECT